ncbi:hypothetical protein BJP36_39950 [Moorena producens JHB]|uniref:Uncharacterized protein n=1 Tax=Moorena producens (strain JHB) TaxID=1454205 RepID=A0A9Q9UV83_MOOP1|nr:hypothetical protein [Moorena producens]WAN68551.1 hypothetical protein BJP36_39950 [Moorena producens JHB]
MRCCQPSAYFIQKHLCIALRQFLSTVPCSLFPVPDFCKKSNVLMQS